MGFVYGIFEVGSNAALYVGHTNDPIEKRFRVHVSEGCRRHCDNYSTGYYDRKPRARLKDYWMFMHAVGVKTLEVRLIASLPVYRKGLERERIEIGKRRPILNCQSDSKSIGPDKPKREPRPTKVPRWYFKHLNDCKRYGWTEVRIQRFDALIAQQQSAA